MGLKVLFVAAECAPLVVGGGLGDIIDALPRALAKLGVEVGIVLPGYRDLKNNKVLPGTRIPLFLVGDEEYFGDSNLPYHGIEKDARRFGYFSRQVAQYLPKWDFKPDVIHVHEWHTALIPALLRRVKYPCATVLTIHNLAMQGVSSGDALFPAGLSVQDLRLLEWDFQDKNIDMLLQGIINADIVSIVSPTYAREILTPEFGEGLHDILKARERCLFGILNGIDYDTYDPARDKDIIRPYGLSDFEAGKAANKETLQKELGLKVDKKAMLVGFVDRLIDQKGLSLISESLVRMMNLSIQLVVLGEGDTRYERRLKNLSRDYASKFSVQIRTDSALARRVLAASDLLLVPSRFEPGGLMPMIAMRYGTLPLARAAGGLCDTITEGECGFVFEKYEVGQMLAALRRALRIFGTTAWRQMIASAMKKDFSWNTSAKKYIELYEKAIEYAKGQVS